MKIKINMKTNIRSHFIKPVYLPLEILNIIMSYMEGQTNDIMKEYFRQSSKYTHDYDEDKPIYIIRKNRIEYRNKYFNFKRYDIMFFCCINCDNSLDVSSDIYYRAGLKLCDMVCFESYYNYY